jgi:hypothetical protein
MKEAGMSLSRFLKIIIKNQDATKGWPGFDGNYLTRLFKSRVAGIKEKLPYQVAGLMAVSSLLIILLAVVIQESFIESKFVSRVPDINRGAINKYNYISETESKLQITDAEVLDGSESSRDARIVLGAKNGGILVYDPNRPGLWDRIPFVNLTACLRSSGHYTQSEENDFSPGAEGSIVDIALTRSKYPFISFIARIKGIESEFEEFALIEGNLSNKTFFPVLHTRQKGHLHGNVILATKSGHVSSFATDEDVIGIYTRKGALHSFTANGQNGSIRDLAVQNEKTWWAGSKGLKVYDEHGDSVFEGPDVACKSIAVSNRGIGAVTQSNNSLYVCNPDSNVWNPVIPFSKAKYISNHQDITDAVLIGNTVYFGKTQKNGIDSYDIDKHKWNPIDVGFSIDNLQPLKNSIEIIAVTGSNGELALISDTSIIKKWFLERAPWQTPPRILSLAIRNQNEVIFATDSGVASWNYRKDHWNELNTFSYRDKNGNNIRLSNSAIHTSVKILLVGQNNKVYALASGRVYSLVDSAWIRQNAYGSDVAEIWLDKNNSIWWMQGRDNSLHTGRRSFFAGTLPDLWDMAAYSERIKRIWMFFRDSQTGFHSSIVYYDLASHTVAPLRDFPSQERAVSLAATSTGAYAITAGGKEVFYPNKGTLRYEMGFGQFPGNRFSDVRSVAQYGRRIWLLGENFLTTYDPVKGQWENQQINPGYIKLVTDGNKLAALQNNGIVTLPSSLNANHPIWDNGVKDIDYNNNIWMVLYNSGRLKLQDTNNQPLSSWPFFDGSCPRLGHPIKSFRDTQDRLLLFGSDGIGRYDAVNHSWEDLIPRYNTRIEQILHLENRSSAAGYEAIIFRSQDSLYRLNSNSNSPILINLQDSLGSLERIALVKSSSQKDLCLALYYSREDNGEPDTIYYDILANSLRPISIDIDSNGVPSIVFEELVYDNQQVNVGEYGGIRFVNTKDGIITTISDKQIDINYEAPWRFRCDKISELTWQGNNNYLLAEDSSIFEIKYIGNNVEFMRVNSLLPLDSIMLGEGLDEYHNWIWNREDQRLSVKYFNSNQTCELVDGRFPEDIPTCNAATQTIWTGSRYGIWETDNGRRIKLHLQGNSIDSLIASQGSVYAMTSNGEKYSKRLNSNQFALTDQFPTQRTIYSQGNGSKLEFVFDRHKMEVWVNGSRLYNPLDHGSTGLIFAFDNIKDMAFDASGDKFWIGTQYNGLWQYNIDELIPVNVLSEPGYKNISKVEAVGPQIWFNSNTNWYSIENPTIDQPQVTRHRNPPKRELGTIDGFLTWFEQGNRIFPEVRLNNRIVSFEDNWLVNRRFPYMGCMDIVGIGSNRIAVLAQNCVSLYDFASSRNRPQEIYKLPRDISPSPQDWIGFINKNVLIRIRNNCYKLEDSNWNDHPNVNFFNPAVRFSLQNLQWQDQYDRVWRGHPFIVADHLQPGILEDGRFSFDVINDAAFNTIVRNESNHEILIASSNLGYYQFILSDSATFTENVTFTDGLGPILEFTKRWGGFYAKNAENQIYIYKAARNDPWILTNDEPFRQKQLVFDPYICEFRIPESEQTKALSILGGSDDQLRNMWSSGIGFFSMKSVIYGEEYSLLATEGGVIRFNQKPHSPGLVKEMRLNNQPEGIQAGNQIPAVWRLEYNGDSILTMLDVNQQLYTYQKKQMEFNTTEERKITSMDFNQILNCSLVSEFHAVKLEKHDRYEYVIITPDKICLVSNENIDSRKRILQNPYRDENIILVHRNGVIGLNDRLETVSLPGYERKQAKAADVIWNDNENRIFFWDDTYFLYTNNDSLFIINNVSRLINRTIGYLTSELTNLPEELSLSSNYRTIWSRLRQLLDSKQIDFDEITLKVIVQCVLESNELTEEEAKKLPIGYTFSIPENCFNPSEDTRVVEEFDIDSILTLPNGQAFTISNKMKKNNYNCITESGGIVHFVDSQKNYVSINIETGDIYRANDKKALYEGFNSTGTTNNYNTVVVEQKINHSGKSKQIIIKHDTATGVAEIDWNSEKRTLDWNALLGPNDYGRIKKIIPSDVPDEAWLITDNLLFHINTYRLSNIWDKLDTPVIP